MGLTITRTGDWFSNVGDRSSAVVTIAFDDNYPTGGEVLTPADLAMSAFDSVQIEPKAGYTFTFDYANNKVLAYVAPAQTHTHNLLLKNAAVADSAGARVNAGANLLGANTGGDLTVTGGGANGGIVSTTLAAAAQTEVAAATNLATLTGVRVRAIGR